MISTPHRYGWTSMLIHPNFKDTADKWVNYLHSHSGQCVPRNVLFENNELSINCMGFLAAVANASLNSMV